MKQAMAVMKFGKHESRGKVNPLGTRWEFAFPNGYWASVIDYGYGSDEGLYEVGVLRSGSLTYKTPITDDVLGWLTAEMVGDALDEIAALTEAPRSVVGGSA